MTCRRDLVIADTASFRMTNGRLAPTRRKCPA
jgi:hypothetical protein